MRTGVCGGTRRSRYRGSRVYDGYTDAVQLGQAVAIRARVYSGCSYRQREDLQARAGPRRGLVRYYGQTADRKVRCRAKLSGDLKAVLEFYQASKNILRCIANEQENTGWSIRRNRSRRTKVRKTAGKPSMVRARRGRCLGPVRRQEILGSR